MRNALTFVPALFLLTAQAQVSNGGFEAVILSKDPETVPSVPYNWAYNAPYGNDLTNDAHGGNYAIAMWNWYWYAEGIVSNGITAWPGKDGLPVTGRPVQLTGWQKRVEGMLQEGENNDARVRVLLTRWNTNTLQRDTLGQGEQLFGEQPAWTPFAIDITYTSAEDADTVVIQLASCVDCICEINSTGECAYFQVDDLALVSTTGIGEMRMEDEAVRLLPQGDRSAVVRVTPGTPLPLRLQLWDAVGRRIGDVRVSSDGQRIALPSVPGVVVFSASAGQRSIARGRIQCVVP